MPYCHKIFCEQVWIIWTIAHAWRFPHRPVELFPEHYGIYMAKHRRGMSSSNPHKSSQFFRRNMLQCGAEAMTVI